MIKNNSACSKICGVVYSIEDIDRIVKYAINKHINYYWLKHLGSNDLDCEDNHKEHYHFILESDSSRRFYVNKFVSDTCGNNLFQKCDNVNAYLRYMTHIDYLDKEHYEINDIVSNISKNDIYDRIDSVIVNTKELDEIHFNTLIEMCCSGQFQSFRQVMSYCLVNNIKYKTSWTTTICNILRSM